MIPGDGDPRHGTTNGYCNLRCRCQPCRAANAAQAQARRIDRAGILADDPTAAPHSEASTYRNWSCRCGPCTAAASLDKRRARVEAKARSAQRRKDPLAGATPPCYDYKP